MTTASTDAMTEVAPLTPHSHGASVLADSRAALIPNGNAMPMNTPMTPRSSDAPAILETVELPTHAAISHGNTTPLAVRTPRHATSRQAPPVRRFASVTMVDRAAPTPAA